MIKRRFMQELQQKFGGWSSDKNNMVTEELRKL